MRKQLTGLLRLNRNDFWVTLGMSCVPCLLVHLVTTIVMAVLRPDETILVGGVVLPFSVGIAVYTVTVGNCLLSYPQAIQFSCNRKRAMSLVFSLIGIATALSVAAAILLLSFERCCAMSVWRAVSGRPDLLSEDFGFVWWSIPLGAVIGFAFGLLCAALLLRFERRGSVILLLFWFGGFAGIQALPWRTHEVVDILFPVLGIVGVLAVLWSMWTMLRHAITK